MRIINASESDNLLSIGKQGENNAVQVRFPLVSEWQSLYGDGVFQLLNLRPSETNSYAVSIETDSDAVLWTVTNTDVAYPGIGRCELCYVVNNTIAKSITFATKIEASIAEIGEEPPEPWQSWVDDVLQAASDAEASADAASDSAADANSAKNEAETIKNDIENGEASRVIAEAERVMAENEREIAEQYRTTYIPDVDANGNISWSNDKGLPNPETKNIQGTKGDKGDKGEKGNVQYAVFAIDFLSGILKMTTTDEYTGGEFSLNNNGELVVSI